MTSQQDPFAFYRLGKEKDIPSSISPKDPFAEEESEKDSSFDIYKITPPETKKGLLSGKGALGIGARVGEIVLGAGGDLRDSFNNLLDLGLKYSPIGQGIEKFTGKELQKVPLKGPITLLPTSEDIKKGITEPLSEKFTGEKSYLEPASDPESYAQEFAQDFTRLVTTPGSGATSLLHKLGITFAGNTAKEIAKTLGFSPSTQELVKMGSMGITSLANLGNAPEFARHYFQNTKNQLQRGTDFATRQLERNLTRLENTDWYRGHNTPSTAAAREMINSIRQRIQNGRINAHDAMTLRENINELRGNYGAYNVQGTSRQQHVNRLNEVQDALIDGMEHELGRTHPQWWQQYQDANQVFGITQNSNAISNFIANNYAKPIISETGKVLFGNALAKGTAGVAKLGIAGVGIATGVRGATIANRLARSPTLRRYYAEVVRESMARDSVAMVKALEKFDEESAKEERQDRAMRVLKKRN